jgi:hypothetical protein
MVQCTPLGICSWSFRLEGEGHGGVTELNSFGESGVVLVDGVSMAVQKLSFLTGEWQVRAGGMKVASAFKPSALLRFIEGEGPSGNFTLEAQSAISRVMLLRMGDGGQLQISPVHPFTRRASIQGEFHDFTTVCFGFWLTAMLWRRAASNHRGVAGHS